jgi:hypothetical protein
MGQTNADHQKAGRRNREGIHPLTAAALPQGFPHQHRHFPSARHSAFALLASLILYYAVQEADERPDCRDAAVASFDSKSPNLPIGEAHIDNGLILFRAWRSDIDNVGIPHRHPRGVAHPDGPIRDDESASLPAGSEQAENLLTSPE